MQKQVSLSSGVLKKVPLQSGGGHSEHIHSVTRESDIAAMKDFEVAKQRLLDINHWYDVCDRKFSEFRVIDSRGDAVEGSANPGFYFSIDLPGPGLQSGEGYDWVRIEKIQEGSDPSTKRNWIIMSVKPSAHPKHAKTGTAHFFTKAASSTFIIERCGAELTAGIYGRNEHPNIHDTPGIPDKIRNMFVATTAMIGLNGAQWKALLHGLLEK